MWIAPLLLSMLNLALIEGILTSDRQL